MEVKSERKTLVPGRTKVRTKRESSEIGNRNKRKKRRKQTRQRIHKDFQVSLTHLPLSSPSLSFFYLSSLCLFLLSPINLPLSLGLSLSASLYLSLALLFTQGKIQQRERERDLHLPLLTSLYVAPTPLVSLSAYVGSSLSLYEFFLLFISWLIELVDVIYLFFFFLPLFILDMNK